MPPRAWVRPVPNSYADATPPPRVEDCEPIAVERAREQHAAVVDGLRWLGFDVTWIPSADELPDSVFVEDPAVLIGGTALIANSAHPVRGREAASVRAALERAGFAIATLPEGATLDGGDVLHLGDSLFVSPSGRTNSRGIEGLAAAFPGRRVIEVPLPDGVLHLKCACSTPGRGVAVLARDTVDPALFEGHDVLEVPRDELYAANVVGRAGRVLIADGFPSTRQVLSEAGFEVRAVELSEIRKGGGSITCLSLRSES